MGNGNGKYKETTSNHMYSMGFLYSRGIFIGQDDKVALKWFKKALKQGHPGAQYEISKYYFEGLVVSRDANKAIELCTKAAEQEHAGAQNKLGICYQSNLGVCQDITKALEWYSKAAKQGHAGAQNNLGVCHYNGVGVVQDYNRAVEWFIKAAQQGYANAQDYLALCYFNGEGVDQDYNLALKWFIKAARQSYANAQNNLAKCYYFGHGADQNRKQAMEWFTKAAQQGHADAQYHLGVCYKNGHGVDQNHKQAFEWFAKAARQGHVDAQFKLGNCYKYGAGVERDNKQAFDLYSKAAGQGHVEAQFNLGKCYKNGEGVEQDHEAALEWLTKAAEQRNAAAAWYLGYMFFMFVKDSSIKYLFKGAKDGDVKSDTVRCLKLLETISYDAPQARYYIGLCYQSGFGTEINEMKAADWFESASQLGDCNAMFRLGSMHLDGKFGARNTIKAADLMFKVAEECDDETLKKEAFDCLVENLSDNSKAMFYIGKCYHNGFGTEKNINEAMKWYAKAAKQGYSEALRDVGLLHFEANDDDKAANFWFQGAKAPRNVPLNKQCVVLLMEKLGGNPTSQFFIGEGFSKGYGMGVNMEKSVEWYRKSADQAHAEALNTLGVCFMNAKGVKSDANEALRLWHLAADQYHGGALLNIGMYFFYGLGGVQSVEHALECYRKAAHLGHSTAQCVLGKLYFYGDGVKKDFAKAYEWFRKAADQDNAEAHFNVGCCYQYGYYVEKDYAESANWYRRAAGLGYAKAQSSLGDYYENGHGVEQSFDKALEWYHRAAEQGEAIAFVCLGDCYFALKKYKQAADNYFIASQKNVDIDPVRLGDCYYLSQGVDQDYNAAVKWYCTAAEKDSNAEAMLKLSNCYKHGHGVDQNSDETFKWLNTAANYGYAEAQFDLGKACERKGEIQQALDWYHRAADQGHHLAYAILNREEGNTNSKADEKKDEMSKYGGENQNNLTCTHITNKIIAWNDSIEIKDTTRVVKERAARIETIRPTIDYMSQKAILFNGYAADFKEANTESTVHTSLTLQVRSVVENDKPCVVKVFPPVKEEEWIEFSENREMKYDLEDSFLTHPMKRFINERSMLRELAEHYDGDDALSSHKYQVLVESFGNISYNKLDRIEPNWVKSSLAQSNLSIEEKDQVVFPAIVMEKRRSNFLMNILQYIDSIALLPEAIRSSNVYRIVGRLLSCLAHIHKMKLVWCNCKPSNFVIGKLPNDDESVDSIDWIDSITMMIDLEGCVTTEGNPITKAWGDASLFAPPEAYQEKDLKAEPSYDIWSLGVTLLILFSYKARRLLLLDDQVLDVLTNTEVIDELNKLDQHLHGYIRSMLHMVPHERPSSSAVIHLLEKNHSSSSIVKCNNNDTPPPPPPPCIDLLHPDAEKQLPRYHYKWTTKTEGQFFSSKQYTFRLLCDGLWVFNEINAKPNYDIACNYNIACDCDCLVFKVKGAYYKEAQETRDRARTLAILGSTLQALAAIRPQPDDNDEKDEVKEALEEALEDYKNDGGRELKLTKEEALLVFKHMNGRGLWDGKTNMGPFTRFEYHPKPDQGWPCYVFLCKKHMLKAREYPDYFVNSGYDTWCGGDGDGDGGTREVSKPKMQI